MGDLYLPYVDAKLLFGGQPVLSTIKCIVDTGASISLLPRHPSIDIALGALLNIPERSVGVNNASGKPMSGIPIEFEVQLVMAPHSLAVQERFWVCNNAAFALLGQTWLEKIGAHFQNFPNGLYKRQFKLYKNPHHQ